MITLQQLKYLVAVADELHFGKAARACGVTQSALSSGLKELEHLLGVTLVERTRRKVMLTPLGEDVVARARTVLRLVDDLVDRAQRGGAPLAGPLRLGVIPTIGPYLLPEALPGLRDRYPDLRLYLREDQTERVLAEVRAGTLDAALIALPYEIGGLRSAVVGEDPLLVACPADHPLAALERVRHADLDTAALLLLEDGHCLREHALEACRLDRPDANETFQATSLRTLVQMVAGGLGVTLIPRIAVEAETRNEPAVAVRPLEEASGRTLALAWRPSDPRERDHQLLAEALRAAL